MKCASRAIVNTTINNESKSSMERKMAFHLQKRNEEEGFTNIPI